MIRMIENNSADRDKARETREQREENASRLIFSLSFALALLRSFSERWREGKTKTIGKPSRGRARRNDEMGAITLGR